MKKITLLVSLFLFAISAMAVEVTETITLPQAGSYTKLADFSSDYLNFTAGGTDVKYKTALRIYGGATLTVTPINAGDKIKSATIKHKLNNGSSGKVTPVIKLGGGTLEGETWKAAAAGGDASFSISNTATAGNIEISAITFVLEVAQLAIEAPVLSVPEGIKSEAFKLAITCPTKGAEIHYSIDGKGDNVYTAEIDINKTTTVTAWSVKGAQKSGEVSATYSFPASVADAASFLKTDGKTLTRIESELVVVAQTADKKYLYVQDNTAMLFIYDGTAVTAFNPGDRIKGLVATHEIYKQAPRVSPALVPAATPGEPVAPVEALLSEITDADVFKYVTIKNVTLAADAKSLANNDGTNSLPVYDRFKIPNLKTDFGGKVVDVIAIVSKYDNLQLLISEIKLHVDGPETAVENAELASNVYANDGTIFIEAEPGDMIQVYTVDGRNIYSAVAESSVTELNLNNNIVIVRVNSEVHKVVVK